MVMDVIPAAITKRSITVSILPTTDMVTIRKSINQAGSLADHTAANDS